VHVAHQRFVIGGAAARVHLIEPGFLALPRSGHGGEISVTIHERQRKRKREMERHNERTGGETEKRANRPIYNTK
jgi:hypothetical protein